MRTHTSYSLAVLLALSFVLTAVVAWTTPFMGTLSPGVDLRVESAGNIVTHTRARRSFGRTRIERHRTMPVVAGMLSSSTLSEACIEDYTGWPLRSLVWRGYDPRDSKIDGMILEDIPDSWQRLVGGVQLRTTTSHSAIIPYYIVWPGLFVNALFNFIVLLSVIAVAKQCRRYVRQQRYQCPTCGYPRSQSARCSECGTMIDAAPSIRA